LNEFSWFHDSHGFIEIGFVRRIFADFAHTRSEDPRAIVERIRRDLSWRSREMIVVLVIHKSIRAI
jgi:hypothetical protein